MVVETSNEQNELVSVIVPCYNIEKYVRRCIESIVNQTYKNIEVLAIDDGSTDKTGHILDKLAKDDDRIIVKHYENSGLSAARNRGLDMMKGSYVTCVDGDDWIDERMVESMLCKIRATGSNLVACNHFLYYGENNIKKGDAQKNDIKWMRAEEAIYKLFDGASHFVAAWAKLYKSALWNNLRYPEDVKFGEDMFLAHILFDRAGKISYIGQSLYYYNQEGTSLVRSEFNKNKLQMVNACEEWVRFCIDKYPKIQEDAKKYYYLTIINMCSHLTTQELHDEYEKYRGIIRKDIKKILSYKLNYKEKIKAVLITFLNNNMYGIIRNLM